MANITVQFRELDGTELEPNGVEDLDQFEASRKGSEKWSVVIRQDSDTWRVAARGRVNKVGGGYVPITSTLHDAVPGEVQAEFWSALWRVLD